MGSLNQVVIIGRLGADPEVRYTNSGMAVCNMRIATDESWTDKDGVKQERTEWHSIVVWGKTGEVSAEYLGKGSEASVVGRLQTRKWQDKEGNDRYSTEIVADRVVFLGSKKDRQQSQQSSPPPGFDEPASGGGGGGGGPSDLDIPFIDITGLRQDQP
jgi:single-strand DNA-binding protein